MNNLRLDSIVREYSDVLHDTTIGSWKFEYRDRVLVIMTGEAANRIRIMTPVAEVADLDEQIWLLCLSANFDRALDARYAVAGDYLWSVFLHPLRQLELAQVVDGMDQVAALAKNFGTSFSSGDLYFQG